MPIDTSMYNQPNGLLSGFETGIRFGDLLRKSRENAQVRSAIQKNIQTNPDGAVSINRSGFLRELAKVQPESVLTYQREFEAQDKDALNTRLAQEKGAREAQAAQLDQRIKELNFFGNLAASVTDQASYERALQMAQQAGADVSQFPPQYDPGLVRNYASLALNQKDKLELERARLGLEAEKVKLQAAKAKVGTGGTASFGKAPPGYRFKPDGSLEPIPGGPAAGKAEMQKQIQERYSNIIVQDANRALNLLKSSKWASGPIAGQSKYIPGTPASNLDQLLASVRANATFDRLQAMRAASPTGGALGSVSDKENAMLQEALGKLDPTLPREMLEDNIKRVINTTLDIVHGPGNGPKRYKLSFDEFGNPIKDSNKKGFTPLSQGVRPQAQTQSNSDLVRAAAQELARRRLERLRAAQQPGGVGSGS